MSTQTCRLLKRPTRGSGEAAKTDEQIAKRVSRRTSDLFGLALVGHLLTLTSELLLGANAQCPLGVLTTFERVSSVTVKDYGQLTVLYNGPNMSVIDGHTLEQNPFSSELSQQDAHGVARHPASVENIPITAECNNRCRRTPKCRAFLVDYAKHTCYSVEYPPGFLGGLARAPAPIHLVPTNDRTSYFEKICLNVPKLECDRAWIYERVLGYQLHGHDDKIIEDVPSRLKCLEYCSSESQFRCRSAEYDYLAMQCRLSQADRHAKPNAFRPISNNIDYFENQCGSTSHKCDTFDRFEDLDLGRAEIMRNANSSEQCQHICTQSIKAFVCRSFTWSPSTAKCYLNSANTLMVGGADRLISAPGLIFFQRNDCVDIKLDCDTTSMTLNLRTNEPFRGRMYVRDEPHACDAQSRSGTSAALSIPFQSGRARCATRELPSRYSSVVVVQQHPLIQRKSDRYIKVVCDFQTANKTISSSYNVVANPWTSTALINSTSFAPKIRMRITDKFGNDITGAKLGDELYLRIEAESESPYDMVARSVLAKSGTSEESLELIDKDGCPTDFRIFPPMKKLNRSTIVGKFDAFKFSSDVVVRFQVDVQFCLNQCPESNCDQQLHNTNPAQLGAAYGGVTTPMLQSGGPADSALVAGAQSAHPTPASRSPSGHHLNKNNFGAHNGSAFFAGRYPSAPANFPTPSSSTGSQLSQMTNSLLDSPDALATPTSDPQTFDASLARTVSSQAKYAPKTAASPTTSARLTGEQQQQPARQKRPLSITGDLETPENAVSDERRLQELSAGEQQSSGSRRRRKRASDGSPGATKHVPLQRDIIVESFPASLPDKPARTRRPNKAADSSTSGLANDLKGNKLANERQQRQLDDESLVCTTRQSLVLVSIVFCAVQLLTVAVCLVSWTHRRDNKFKLKQPALGRLY